METTALTAALPEASPDPTDPTDPTDPAFPHISREFVLAGAATFTVECPDGTHHTYHVARSPATDRWAESYFAKVLTGPDNSDYGDFTYLGKLDDFTGQVRTTKASMHLADSYATKLLNRILARVWGDDHEAYERHGYRTMHCGRCGKCGRKLTTPDSVARGIGPECARKLAEGGAA